MSTLVFTVALNGYAGAYRTCLRSQRAYADRLGATYVAVDRPFVVKERALSAWLKVSLLVDALEASYDWVAFIDSDAEVRADAPDFRELTTGGVHAALGRSGRYNSGVLLVKVDGSSRSFFSTLLASAATAVSEEDRAGLKYENGNFIHVAKSHGGVTELPLHWNNTHDPALHDHVRHFTGPLRSEYRRSRVDERVFAARQRLSAPAGPAPESRDPAFLDRLGALTRHVQRRHPALVR